MGNENKPRLFAGTIVARNYLAHARVLARSFGRHHPGQSLTVLVIDDPERTTVEADEPFHVVHLDEIVAAGELARLLMIYDVKELATAAKPLLLRWALGQGAPAALYLDPDIEVFASLDGIGSLAEEHGIVLTPHTISPMPRDNRRPSEADILAAGVYNLGFLAVSRRANEFLDWWWDRLRRHCIVDPGSMLFVDQRWIDFVPAFFPHVVLRDPGANVAYWNVDSRKVSWTGDGFDVDGVPLRFFHFSGFSPETPWMLTTHFKSDRILLSENDALRRLCESYAEELLEAGYFEAIAERYAWDRLPSGLKLTSGLRRMYRAALIDWESGDERVAPPSPFGPDSADEFLRWLNEPVVGRGRWQLSRYILAIYNERPDVQAAYPELAGPDVEEFFRWVAAYGIREHEIPEELTPAEVLGEVPQATPPAEFGANVVGYLRAELGVGEAGRLLVAALSAADVGHVTRVYDRTISRQQHTFTEVQPSEEPYAFNLMCVNADQMESFSRFAGRSFFADRYSIGLWFWEVEEFPLEMCTAFDYVDEVWVASDFVREAIAARTDKPVTTIDLPIVAPPPLDLDRRRLGLSDRPVFLYMYDFMSVLERKNPLGLIEAFSRAFEPGEGPVLVLKSINGDRRRADLERVRFAAGRRADITVWDGYVSPEDRLALIGASDCYVSLHRSEGFGLTMAEALSLGRPVVATAYSGNMAFMQPDDAYLVDYSLVPIPKGSEPYPSTARWADPDLDQAAAYMRTVVENPVDAAARASAARERLLAARAPAVAGAGMRARLEAIARARAAVPVEPVGPVTTPPGGRRSPASLVPEVRARVRQTLGSFVGGEGRPQWLRRRS